MDEYPKLGRIKINKSPMTDKIHRKKTESLIVEVRKQKASEYLDLSVATYKQVAYTKKKPDWREELGLCWQDNWSTLGLTVNRSLMMTLNLLVYFVEIIYREYSNFRKSLTEIRIVF